MYTLFSDKKEDFKCKVQVEGSSLNKTQARLVLKGTNKNIMFEGNISPDGMCVIPINGLRSIFNEGENGQMVLEVITDGNYFSPWQDDFDIKLSKNVTVEVFDNKEKENIKEMVTVEVEKPKSPKKIKKTSSQIVAEELLKNNINMKNILKNKRIVKEVISSLEESKRIKPIQNTNKFIRKIITHLN